MYARILNVFDVVCSNYQDRDLFKMDCFAKRIMPQCRCATINFSGQKGRFREIGHFEKKLSKVPKNRSILELFLLDTLKASFEWKI